MCGELYEDVVDQLDADHLCFVQIIECPRSPTCSGSRDALSIEVIVEAV
jgi:hypothetical protein